MLQKIVSSKEYMLVCFFVGVWPDCQGIHVMEGCDQMEQCILMQFDAFCRIIVWISGITLWKPLTGRLANTLTSSTSSTDFQDTGQHLSYHSLTGWTSICQLFCYSNYTSVPKESGSYHFMARQAIQTTVEYDMLPPISYMRTSALSSS